MITDETKKKIIEKIETEYGVHRLFDELGFENVTSTGGRVYSVCPFHEGADNPTGFSYSDHMGYCFTHCHRRFDIFDVVMKSRSCDFSESVEYLSELVGVNVSYKRASAVDKLGVVNKDFLNSLKRAKKRKQSVEWTPLNENVFDDISPSMHTLLRKENFDNDTKDMFEIGFATSGYLEGRITIPIRHMNGELVTISGRLPMSKSDIDERGLARYKIWYNTEKSVTLYNIDKAIPYIEITGEVIVVEGFKAVWRLFQYGYGNVVGVMGSSISAEQVKILKRLGCKVVVCGDKDEAGQKLNQQVKRELEKFNDVTTMDMFLLGVPETSSLDDVSQEDFDYIYEKRK